MLKVHIIIMWSRTSPPICLSKKLRFYNVWKFFLADLFVLPTIITKFVQLMSTYKNVNINAIVWKCKSCISHIKYDWKVSCFLYLLKYVLKIARSQNGPFSSTWARTLFLRGIDLHIKKHDAFHSMNQIANVLLPQPAQKTLIYRYNPS